MAARKKKPTTASMSSPPQPIPTLANASTSSAILCRPCPPQPPPTMTPVTSATINDRGNREHDGPSVVTATTVPTQPTRSKMEVSGIFPILAALHCWKISLTGALPTAATIGSLQNPAKFRYTTIIFKHSNYFFQSSNHSFKPSTTFNQHSSTFKLSTIILKHPTIIFISSRRAPPQPLLKFYKYPPSPLHFSHQNHHNPPPSLYSPPSL